MSDNLILDLTLIEAKTFLPFATNRPSTKLFTIENGLMPAAIKAMGGLFNAITFFYTKGKNPVKNLK